MSGPGEDGLPSYEDVLKEEERLQQNQRPQHGQDLPPSYSRPPQRPPSVLSKDQPNPLDLVQSHLNCQVGQVLNQLIRNQPNQPNQLQSPRRVSNLNHLIYHGSIQRVIIVRSVGIQGTR